MAEKVRQQIYYLFNSVLIAEHYRTFTDSEHITIFIFSCFLSPLLPDMRKYKQIMQKYFLGRFDYGCLPHATNPGHTVMHYLQIIWADATNLGCAAHACRESKRSGGKVRTYYLCLYCPGSVCTLFECFA